MSCLPCCSTRPRSRSSGNIVSVNSPQGYKTTNSLEGGQGSVSPNPLHGISSGDNDGGTGEEETLEVVEEGGGGALETSAVKVCIRVRPALERESSSKEGGLECLSSTSIKVPDKEGGGVGHTFSFDSILPTTATQGETYTAVASSVLEKALLGFNATVFAYGQTGSGKTYTMEGVGSGETSGVIPRLATALFSAASTGRRSGGKRLESLECSSEYIEIYNERVRDLLGDGHEDSEEGEGGGGLHIRQTVSGEIFVEGAVCRPCPTLASLVALLAEGSQRRRTGETNMNAHSSRSHAVLTLHLTSVWGGVKRTSKLHLIDLAGSERADATGARGERLKEGAAINKSLSALGGVIAALTTPGRTHIPYRDSKLTRLLQDSLGGNAITVMLCCVSPSLGSLDETLSSLRFAERAKKVRNVARVNIDPLAAKLAALDAQVGTLRARGALLEAALARRLGFSWPCDPSSIPPSKEAKARLEEEVGRTREDMKSALGGVLSPFAVGATSGGVGDLFSTSSSSAPMGGGQGSVGGVGSPLHNTAKVQDVRTPRGAVKSGGGGCCTIA